MSPAGPPREFEPVEHHGDDAHVLLAARVHALCQLPYAELRRRAGKTELELLPGLEGDTFERRTSVVLTNRGAGEELGIRVAVSRPGLRNRLSPAEEVLYAMPDGTFHREWTAASLGEERWGFALPLWVSVVAAVVGILGLLAWYFFAPI